MLFMTFFFFAVFGFELMLLTCGQVLPYLSHICCFCSEYFGDRVSLFAQAGLDVSLPILCFLLLLG
jgi:hypothetical protein